jgi:GNAT superfamily N-acetyltransferase
MTDMSNAAWRVRAAVPGDFDRWRELFEGYCDFYQIEPPDVGVVWSWIHDPASPVECLLAVDAGDRAVGLAHFRPFHRPSRAAIGGFLDDLFVDPAVRGGGAADALLLALKRLAAERGWNVVRWITADDNHRARAKYDQYATRTMWVTYDMAP